MQDTNNKNAPLELGRLIHILSCKMKCQNDCYTILEDSDLTPVQQQLLKFILLESAHKPIFQRDIEEAFQIRRSTVTGIIKLIEQKGYITRTSVESDARLKQLVPTEKAEALRPRIDLSFQRQEIPAEIIMQIKVTIKQNITNFTFQTSEKSTVARSPNNNNGNGTLNTNLFIFEANSSSIQPI